MNMETKDWMLKGKQAIEKLAPKHGRITVVLTLVVIIAIVICVVVFSTRESKEEPAHFAKTGETMAQAEKIDEDVLLYVYLCQDNLKRLESPFYRFHMGGGLQTLSNSYQQAEFTLSYSLDTTGYIDAIEVEGDLAEEYISAAINYVSSIGTFSMDIIRLIDNKEMSKYYIAKDALKSVQTAEEKLVSARITYLTESGFEYDQITPFESTDWDRWE